MLNLICLSCIVLVGSCFLCISVSYRIVGLVCDDLVPEASHQVLQVGRSYGGCDRG